MFENKPNERVGMKHAVSMPEFSEIQEIIEFDNVMEEINQEHISDERHTTSKTKDRTMRKDSIDLFNCTPLLSNNIINNENIYKSEVKNQKLKGEPINEKNLIPFVTDDDESDDDNKYSSSPFQVGADDKDTSQMKNFLRKSSSFSELDKIKKRVQFGDIKVREYGVTLGDHPDCARGPPLSLNWDYVELGTKNVDTYESSRKPRRTRETLCMSLSARKQLLLNTGFTKYELREAANEVKKVQKNRKSSEKYYPIYDASFAIRSVAKSIRKSVVSSSPSKKANDYQLARSMPNLN